MKFIDISNHHKHIHPRVMGEEKSTWGERLRRQSIKYSALTGDVYSYNYSMPLGQISLPAPSGSFPFVSPAPSAAAATVGGGVQGPHSFTQPNYVITCPEFHCFCLYISSLTESQFAFYSPRVGELFRG